MKQEAKGLLWFSGGFALAAILTVSLEAVRYVPMAIAFGLLCFGCGVVLFVFLDLRRREEEFRKTTTDSYNRWVKEFDELREKESNLEKEREVFETGKEEWEDAKVDWEADKETSIFSEIARMSAEEPGRLLAFHKKALQLAEDEAARRGGDQIDRDLQGPEEET